MECVYVTKSFKRVISGLGLVIYVMCIYNKKFKACDQWLRFCYICSVYIIITKNFKRVISGLDFVIHVYVVCIYNKKF